MNAYVLVFSALVAVAYTALTDDVVKQRAQRWIGNNNYRISQFSTNNYPVITSVYFYLKL